MTKRLTIALIAFVALVLVAVLPVSATYYNVNNTVICDRVNSVYWRTAVESDRLAPAGIITGTQFGWWASAAPINTTAPSQTITLANNNSFYVSPTLAPYAGNWYVLPYRCNAPVSIYVSSTKHHRRCLGSFYGNHGNRWIRNPGRLPGIPYQL